MLEDFISNNYSPERQVLIVDALVVLAEFNSTDVLPAIENVLNSDDSFSTFDMINKVNGLVVESLLDILRKHGITITLPNSDLKLLGNIAKSLYLVITEYDADYILTNVDFNIDETNENLDILANLVGLVTDTTSDDVYDSVALVDGAALVAVSEILQNRLVTAPEPDSINQVDRYKDYLSGRRTGVIYEAVKNGMVVGQLEIDDIYLLLGEVLFKLPSASLHFELISLVLISSEEDILTGLALVSSLYTESTVDAELLLEKLKADFIKNKGVL